MKAHEFDKGAPKVSTKNSPVGITPTLPIQSKSPPVLHEAAKHKKATRVTHTPHTSDVFGVDDAQGHVIRRIAHAKPAIWAKIQNWD